MSKLRLESWTMPAADLGLENPLPPLRATRDVHTDTAGDPRYPCRNVAEHGLRARSQYLALDHTGYTRELCARAFRVAVLENEYLRATFLLEFGGRLWSLLHKPSGRELLDTNPVFQPANLAQRRVCGSPSRSNPPAWIRMGRAGTPAPRGDR